MSEEPETQLQDVRGGKPSASALFRLYSCPGSWKAEQQCLPEEESEAAAMGTRLHKHMEEGTLPADPEEAEACEWCRDMADTLAEQHLGAGYTVHCREERWWAHDGAFSGQPDLVLRSADGANFLILDYKFGRVEVAPAERNLQLAALAVLLGEQVEVQDVYAAILQPYVSRKVPRAVRYSPSARAKASAAIDAAIAAANAENPELRPSEYACRYCKAAVSCPAAHREALRLNAFDRWQLLPLETRRAMWNSSQLMRKLCDKVDAAVKVDLEAGFEIPGLMLAEGRKSFTVTDATAAFGVAEGLGVTAQEFAGCCKVNISSLDKVVHIHLKEKDAKQKVKESSLLLRNLLQEAGCGEMKVSAGSVKEVKE